MSWLRPVGLLTTLLAGSGVLLAAAGSFDLVTARLIVEPGGGARLAFADGACWPISTVRHLIRAYGYHLYDLDTLEL